jgi:serine phosphatase RsbU (regulator of sigma subunit)
MPTIIPTLILDDCEADADRLRRLLRNLDPTYQFDVTWLNDPHAALEKIAAGQVGLVLLDYHMPVMDGLAVLQKIRDHDRTLPVIMLTGLGNEAVAVAAMKHGAHDYLKKDELTAPALARAIMTVLERKRLEDELAAQTRAREQDLQLARELQQAFLPQNLPHFAPNQRPDTMGLRFYHRYQPTFAVGGDFFDVLPIDDHTVGVFVSDVAGHGMQAALVTAVLRTLLEELREEAGDADAFLGRINAGLYRVLRQVSAPIYASAFYLKLDMQEKRGAFANAGHPPQLHLRRREGEVVRLFDKSKTGPVLGLEKNATYPAHGFAIESDDGFILFTDGLVAAANPTGESFGFPRLIATAKKFLTAPPGAIMDELVHAATAHAGALPDDVCVVAVEAAMLLAQSTVRVR